jgi:hypothetical protein
MEKENLNEPNDIHQIIGLCKEKMDELIGWDDYYVSHHSNTNRIVVSFNVINVESSGEMAEEVANFINDEFEKNIVRVGNYGDSMFWLAFKKNIKMKTKEEKINYIVSTIAESEIANGQKPTNEEFLSIVRDIICQFDTDIAIDVMENLTERFGQAAKDQALIIRINYGY